MDQQETGNPVFDYRAGFRRFAARVQWLYLAGGVVLLACAVADYFTSGKLDPRITGSDFLDYLLYNRDRHMVILGVLAIVFGCAWGGYWRRKVRLEFREKYR